MIIENQISVGMYERNGIVKCENSDTQLPKCENERNAFNM